VQTMRQRKSEVWVLLTACLIAANVVLGILWICTVDQCSTKQSSVRNGNQGDKMQRTVLPVMRGKHTQDKYCNI